MHNSQLPFPVYQPCFITNLEMGVTKNIYKIETLICGLAKIHSTRERTDRYIHPLKMNEAGNEFSENLPFLYICIAVKDSSLYHSRRYHDQLSYFTYFVS